MEAVLLLGQDTDRDIEPLGERGESVAEEPAPVLADVAELAGQRVRRLAGRLTQELEERQGAARAVGVIDRERSVVALEVDCSFAPAR